MKTHSIFVGLLLLASSGPALAHAHLQASEPAVGSTVAAAPHEIVIGYSEGVEPKFSAIEVRDASGARVDKGDLHNGAEGQSTLIESLQPLQPGLYTVSWSAISVDTHHTTGNFTFTVAAP